MLRAFGFRDYGDDSMLMFRDQSSGEDSRKGATAPRLSIYNELEHAGA